MRLRRLAFLVPAATALLYACDDTHEHNEPQSDIGDVILEGSVTDETYVAFESALEQGPPESDPSQAAMLDQPADGAALPRSPAPTFTWHFGAAASRSDGPPAGHRTARAPAAPAWIGLSPAPATVTSLDRLTAPLRDLLGPLRSAHAHGDPYSGTATYLRFSIDAAPTLIEGFTSKTSYTPSAASWEKLTGAGAPITLTLVSAVFEQNRVSQDGGPFAGSAVTFTIAP